MVTVTLSCLSLCLSLGSLESFALGIGPIVRTLTLAVRNPDLYKPLVNLEVDLPSLEGCRPAQKFDYILVREQKLEPLPKTPPQAWHVCNNWRVFFSPKLIKFGSKFLYSLIIVLVPVRLFLASESYLTQRKYWNSAGQMHNFTFQYTVLGKLG